MHRNTHAKLRLSSCRCIYQRARGVQRLPPAQEPVTRVRGWQIARRRRSLGAGDTHMGGSEGTGHRGRTATHREAASGREVPRGGRRRRRPERRPEHKPSTPLGNPPSRASQARKLALCHAKARRRCDRCSRGAWRSPRAFFSGAARVHARRPWCSLSWAPKWLLPSIR